MEKLPKKCLFAITVILAALLILACKEKTVPPRTVRIAIQPSAAFIPLYAARYSGLIENALAARNVTVIWQDFESGPPMNESLAADLTDIGVIGDVPTVRALAGSTRMKLVGIPASGPNAYALIASSENASFNSYKDLKGKKIATVFGSTGHNFVTKLLGKAGLSFEDIEFVSITAPNAEQALKSGTADAVAIWEPNITRIVGKGAAKIVAQGDETSLRGTNGFVVREDYLADNADIISEILGQYSAAVQMLPSLSPEMLAKISDALGVTGDQLQAIARKYDFGVEITDEDINALQDTISFLESIHGIEHVYRVERFMDKSCFKPSH